MLVIIILRNHFCNFCNGDDETNSAQRQTAPFYVVDEGQYFGPPDLAVVNDVISKLLPKKLLELSALMLNLIKQQDLLNMVE